MKHHIVIYFSANPLPDKILFLKLWVKMLMANHIENLLKYNLLNGQSYWEFAQERSARGIKIPYRKILLFWCGWPGMPKVLKVTKLQNLGKKEFRHKFNFLHEDQNQSFLEADTIVFGDYNQACPKYSKQQVFAMSQERRETWSWFFAWR